MAENHVPKSFEDLVESEGGFVLEGVPPRDVEGWVLAVTFFDPANPKQTIDAEILFVDEVCANAFGKSILTMLDRNFDGWLLGQTAINSTKDFYYCAFCGCSKREAGCLLRGAAGRSICDKCVDNFSRVLALHRDAVKNGH